MSVKIALSTQLDSLGVSPNYRRALESLGCEVVDLPLVTMDNIDEILDNYDGFILTGGADINPLLYGEKNLYATKINDDRDNSDVILTKALIKSDKPLLAICRGMQLLNTICGGTLYQDLTKQNPECKINHLQSDRSYEYVHKVNILPDTLLADICPSVINVNTIHHQAVKKLGEGLFVAAVSNDNIIEAVEMKDKKFVLGLQWHPERLTTYSEHNAILSMFVDECERQKSAVNA